MRPKISPTLTRLCEEDLTLTWQNEHATGQTILAGMGDQHIDAAIRRAQSKFQVGLVMDEPKVPTAKASPARHRPSIATRNNLADLASSARFNYASNPTRKVILSSLTNWLV